MRKIIALALITSFAVTGAAMARGANGQGGGGNDGPGAGDNAAEPAMIRAIRPPTFKPRPAPKKVEFCHIAGLSAPTDYECGHNSR